MRVVPAPVDSPAAQQLLMEYFTARELGFIGGTYQVNLPDPARFIPPEGVFLLVEDDDGEPVGCGGIRRLEPTGEGARYEVKHLFLRDSTRGRGWGRALLETLEREAASLGARTVVLDTNASLTAAGGLYRSAGYREIEPYNDNPNATHWYEKTLP